jgi:hypothetical protein
MRLSTLFAVALVLTAFAARAQSPRVTVKGTLIDSSQTALSGATVMLLLPKDSSLVSFGRTTDKGTFEFRGVRRGAYLFKASYVGYLPVQQDFTTGDGEGTDLGTIRLKPIAKELFEVVIKTAKAPLSIRGDTIEYNASSFKVPPGSTVEDLLRKLPGMQVDQDGNIKAQGQDVKRVTVDGKEFFGGDPKAATKNLPADALSKVQVFDGKSEQARITGIDDGKKEKTLNLELKEDAKKGAFGKVTAGVGTKERAELKGNYNRFNKKEQFSVLGFGNNTNQTGVSFDDYQDFRGSQSFNFGDDATFGFSSGGRFITFDDDNTAVPLGGNRNRGFSNNFGLGVNYNYTTKKTKLSTNYFYNQSKQALEALLNRETFLPRPRGSLLTTDDNTRFTFNGNHRLGVRWEANLDSSNTLLLLINGRGNTGNERFDSNQLLNELDSNRAELPDRQGQTVIDNDNEFDALTLSSSLIYRHKFRKKGRNFAASVSYNRNNSDGLNFQRSDNTFPDRAPLRINQRVENESEREEYRSSLLFIEPFAKKFYWETFYNVSLRRDEVDRNFFDRTESGEQFNATLSRYYTNRLLFNRLGSSVRYSHKGLNLSAGLAAQQFNQQGQFAVDQAASSFTEVNRSFFNLLPNASLNYDLKKNRYLYGGYSVDTRQPSTRDLQPIEDNSNPRYIQVGNPELLPALNHNVNLGFNKFNPGTFVNLFLGLNYTYNVNQIVYNQTVNEQLVTRTQPVNLSGGQNAGGYFGFGFPLKKTKATMNLNTSLNFGKSPIYINGILNQTFTDNLNLNLRLDLTPSNKFTLYSSAGFNLTDAQYSINTTQNSQFTNQTYTADGNAEFGKGLFLNANFNYRIFQNPRFGINQDVPILNLALYKIFLKSKKAEVRLTAYDVLNRNLGVTQSQTANFVTTERVSTLARYFMLSLTYNMRGVTSQMRRRGFF